MELTDDTVLTLTELAKILRLDKRALLSKAHLLGGERFGNRWRFIWGTVKRNFGNAYIEKRQWEQLDGPRCDQRQAVQQDVSAREKGRPGMEGRKTMGGRSKKQQSGTRPDPFGLRATQGMAEEVSGRVQAQG